MNSMGGGTGMAQSLIGQLSGRGGSMGSSGSSRQRPGNLPGDRIPKGYETGQLQQYTPEQLQLFQQLFSNVGPDSFLSKLGQGDEETYNQMEAPALRQFNELQGNLASRFSGMGMGARKSSGFQNSANQAASNFAQELQAKRSDYSRQALRDLHSMSQDLLGNRPYERDLFEKPQKNNSSGWGGLIGAGLGGIGGFLAGGPSGALAGSKLGHGIGSAF